MHTPHFKFLVSTLTAFALGVAVCAAWFLARQPPAPLPVIGTEKARGDAARNEVPAATDVPSVPWKTQKAQEASGAVASELEKTGETEVPDKHTLAQRNHEARKQALRMSSWLGLDSQQASSLEEFLLAEGADGIVDLPWDLEKWTTGNLKAEQTTAYDRYQKSFRRNEAETDALAEVHRIAQAMELSEEQRDALFERAFEIYLLSAEAASPQEFFQRDKPRQANEPSWIGVARGLIDGLYRSVLTKEQVDTYGAFLSKQQELEERMEEEAE